MLSSVKWRLGEIFFECAPSFEVINTEYSVNIDILLLSNHVWNKTVVTERKPPPRRAILTESDAGFDSGFLD